MMELLSKLTLVPKNIDAGTRCVVRLITTSYFTSKGVAFKKELVFQKKLSKYNWFTDGCLEPDDIQYINGFDEFEDGLYELIAVGDGSRGNPEYDDGIDHWKLIPFEKD